MPTHRSASPSPGAFQAICTESALMTPTRPVHQGKSLALLTLSPALLALSRLLTGISC